MVEHFYRRFDVIREQEFDIIRGGNFSIREQTLNGGMLNTKQIENNLKWLTFCLIFLTCWLGGKLESLSSLLRVCWVYPESNKKRVLHMSQLTEDKWIHKLIRVSELTREFDNHDHLPFFSLLWTILNPQDLNHLCYFLWATLTLTFYWMFKMSCIWNLKYEYAFSFCLFP